MGKEELKSIKDLPEDFEFDDVLLNETVNITADLCAAQEQHLYKKSEQSVLQRFAPPKNAH